MLIIGGQMTLCLSWSLSEGIVNWWSAVEDAKSTQSIWLPRMVSVITEFHSFHSAILAEIEFCSIQFQS